MQKQPDFIQTLSEMDGGMIETLLGKYLAEASMGSIQQGKPGQVILKITTKQIDKSQQVSVTHEISYSRPTATGKTTEDHKTSTPMHVNNNGCLSIVPEQISENIIKEVN